MKRDKIIFILIVILAAILRFYQLDVRVFHHDESAVGSITYKLFRDGTYTYNPAFHGPFLYYLTAFMFNLFGDSDFTARLMPAIFGVALILLLYPLREDLGKGYIIASAFLAISPSFLYYSRFFRNDILVAFFTLAVVVCTLKYFSNKNNKTRFIYLFFGAVALGLSASAKENTYVTLAIFVSFLFLFYLIKYIKYRIIYINIKRTLIDIPFFILIFFIVFAMFYTNFFADITNLSSVIEGSFGHWWEMHKIERIGGPFYFYIPLIVLYELPILIFGIFGGVYYLRKSFSISPFSPASPTVPAEGQFPLFLIYWFLMSFIAYSYIQEKVPWLILHILLPLTLLAGMYLGDLIPNLKHGNIKIEAIVATILIISSSFFVYTSIRFNYYDYANAAEPLIQAAQPPQKFKSLLEKIEEVSSQYRGKYTEIQEVDKELDTQFLWYLRHYKNIQWHVDINSTLDAPIIVVHDTDAKKVESKLHTDYNRLDSARMAWYWYKPSDITLNFILFRIMDRKQSEYGVVLFYKRGKG